MTGAAAARMRLAGMIRKESLQILRDPSSIAIAFVMPLVLLLLFGYGVSLDARHIPLAVVRRALEPHMSEAVVRTGDTSPEQLVLTGKEGAREAARRVREAAAGSVTP